MKKIMFFAAVAAVFSLASCQKEALNEAAGTESPVFTATISTGTKTTVNATDGKVAWESTDKITITDASAAFATYKIKSIDGNTGKATFEVESGTLGQGPYTATYGTAPTTAQTYSATPGNLYMTAPETSANSFTFTVQCGLMEINLTKADESVKSIAVTGTPTGKSETTYTLTCTPAQNIATKKSFYIALPAGIYNKIVITDSNDKVCTLTAVSGLTLENNHIKPITFGANKLNFLPAGALKGEFSVGPNATDKVHFSQGNLYAKKTGDNWNWGFYDEQYKYNSIATSSGKRTANANDTEIDLFTWGYDNTSTNTSYSLNPVNTKGISGHTTDGETFSSSEDWGYVFGGESSVWRTLTSAEWQYLFNTRSNASNLYMCGVTVCGSLNCLVIAPDDWDLTAHPLQSSYGTDSSEGNPMTWEQAEAKGLVCLPAAGYRHGSDVDDVGDYGLYRSSTANDSDLAYIVSFYSSDVYPDDGGYRDFGFSVRLITESN